MAEGKFYAEKNGKVPGIYKTWDECRKQVNGYPGATYKSFKTLEEAQQFMGNHNALNGEKRQTNSSIVKKIEKEIETTAPSISDILSDATSDIMVAYVDGSYEHSLKEFSYGAVIAYKGKEYHFGEKMSDESLVSMRNVAGEIKGAEFAMKFAKEHNCNTLYIYHDYEGISKWCLGEWNANKEGTKAYQKLFQSIQEDVTIHFVKVKGHSNDTYNDLADTLAKKALGIL